jgi:hypothetical protein
MVGQNAARKNSLETSEDSDDSSVKLLDSLLVPKGEPMPEFILIQREKQHVVRKLVVRAATMKYP